jgi:hypothetical protein
MPLILEIAEADVEILAQAAREAIDARLNRVPDARFPETFWTLIAQVYARSDEDTDDVSYTPPSR